MRFLLAIILLLAPVSALAAEEVSFAGAMLQMLAALAIVLGLLLLLYWLMRRLAPRQMLGHSAGNMKVWGRLGLGARKSLALVEVGNKMLVLGLGEKDITLLAEINSQEEIAQIKQGSGFARLGKKSKDSFMNILKGRQNNEP